MAKKNTTPAKANGYIAKELIARSHVELVKLADGSTAYKKKNFVGRVKAWANPNAGKEIRGVGFEKVKDENGKDVWVASKVMTVYKNRALQKAGYGILVGIGTFVAAVVLANALAKGPIQDPGTNDIPTVEVGTNDNQNQDQNQNQNQNQDQNQNQNNNNQDQTDTETEGPGFVVETPEEGKDTNTPPGGFKVDTVTPPAADNTQDDTSTPTTPGQDTSTPEQDTSTPGQDTSTNNGGGSGTPDKFTGAELVLE